MTAEPPQTEQSCSRGQLAFAFMPRFPRKAALIRLEFSARVLIDFFAFPTRSAHCDCVTKYAAPRDGLYKKLPGEV